MKETKLEVPCYVAEFIGTFAIVLFGCGSIAALPEGPAKHLSVNLAFGLTVAAMIYALGHVSRAHFNPAVTIGFVASRRFPLKSGLAYITAQCLGALTASAILALLFPTGNLGATTPSIPLVQALLVEALLTFFLVFVIAGTATDRRANPGLAGAAIGATVFICGLFAGSLTGNSLNPARSLGPALFQPAALGSLWAYFVGPIIGGVCATLTYRWLASGNQTAAELEGCC
ncbi:MAG: MIP family channel protein [Chlorobia bacterium]|nr:MIP family channel protein [Fimbriimonadaceae bacterium]